MTTVMDILYICGPTVDQFKFEGFPENINFKECNKCLKKICLSDIQIKESEETKDKVYFYCLRCMNNLYKKEKEAFTFHDARDNPLDSGAVRNIFEDFFK